MENSNILVQEELDYQDNEPLETPEDPMTKVNKITEESDISVSLK